MPKLYNHQTASLSLIDLRMIRSVPSGGNWKNIPKSIPSERIKKIRVTGGRTTYYGRLRWDKPSYTINTYFNRPGNGCFMHPDDEQSQNPQHRLLSFREAARIQSFQDDFKFYGSKTSIFKQIGNAVPPLMAYFIAKKIKAENAIDLFCGCGGLSKGFELAGTKILIGCDKDKNFMETWKNNHKGIAVTGSLTEGETKKLIIQTIKKKLKGKKLDIIIGGPPCQGFSTAGWRLDGDDRNKLWNEYLDLVKVIRPKYFLIENVVGLLTSMNKSKNVVENMESAFSNIGYNFKYKKIESQFLGVPQVRKRIFIFGALKNLEMPEYPKEFVKKFVTVEEAIKGMPRLKENDGNFEISFNVKNYSTYQKWLSKKITLARFVKYLKNEKS
ncbi:DNA (cytosine-5-)-methyltransferase [Candidatus Pelagibacter sp.]|jgi:DNA (cytosine-5)-methyltransferase 1|nr:DNA (cytosine-5-)-methyltransferase [Candidatus Pelagibacter sp.]MDB3971738.1 DNA (cytosine-5-)-methyltransferase [Candidatus Pelagibacter sp.]|tara:strand:+ start:1972 stop:3126 length:1155 start_codon:yes stop_codon:yes gene_type:complete